MLTGVSISKYAIGALTPKMARLMLARPVIQLLNFKEVRTSQAE